MNFQTACLDGDVRLVGGSSSSEGTVQVCYLNGWGIISDEGWGTEEAQVVCRQLNYTDSNNCYSQLQQVIFNLYRSNCCDWVCVWQAKCSSQIN